LRELLRRVSLRVWDEERRRWYGLIKERVWEKLRVWEKVT
jgi:hypothetical protein